MVICVLSVISPCCALCITYTTYLAQYYILRRYTLSVTIAAQCPATHQLATGTFEYYFPSESMKPAMHKS